MVTQNGKFKIRNASGTSNEGRRKSPNKDDDDLAQNKTSVVNFRESFCDSSLSVAERSLTTESIGLSLSFIRIVSGVLVRSERLELSWTRSTRPSTVPVYQFQHDRSMCHNK